MKGEEGTVAHIVRGLHVGALLDERQRYLRATAERSVEERRPPQLQSRGLGGAGLSLSLDLLSGRLPKLPEKSSLGLLSAPTRRLPVLRSPGFCASFES